MEPEREGLKRQEHLPESVPDLGVGEVTVVVELGRIFVRPDVELRLVDEVDVQEHPDLSQVERRPASPEVAPRRHDRRRLVAPAVAPSGRPVQRVLQRAYIPTINRLIARFRSGNYVYNPRGKRKGCVRTGEGVVVLRGGEEEAVGVADPGAEGLDVRREAVAAVGLEVRVAHGQAGDVDVVDEETRDGLLAQLLGFLIRTEINNNTVSTSR